ncbi:AAA family ATPase [Amorphus coralli]|uniref:AAA family ATPase n=1 Tax=Amorphus coralli TaxID=340680 RepID=UPI00036E0BFA|nr:AAA family ATPase [Amorphus coralli]
MLLTLAVSGYRSLRDLVLPLDRLTIVTGPNGSGKSSLYRAIRLLADTAQGRVIGSLAAEGGLQSTLWAGPEEVSRRMRIGEVPLQGTIRRNRIQLRLGFASEDYGYALDLGLPQDRGIFGRDPQIKCEAVWAGEVMRRGNVLARRTGPLVEILEDGGERVPVLTDLPSFESMMTHAADPRHAPELLALRERMRGWRFYDHFRVDADGPPRRARVGTRTPVLAADGADLAAAIATIREIGDPGALDEAIDDAFPGSEVEVTEASGLFEIRMHQKGLLRPLGAAELSDGTLRYLLLVAALLSPRPPSLLVLNEPETSLHPDLIAPLGRLIARACDATQVIVVTHAASLVDGLGVVKGARLLSLEKRLGETAVDCEDRPRWEWPKR